MLCLCACDGCYTTALLYHCTAMPLHYTAIPLHCHTTALQYHFTYYSALLYHCCRYSAMQKQTCKNFNLYFTLHCMYRTFYEWDPVKKYIFWPTQLHRNGFFYPTFKYATKQHSILNWISIWSYDIHMKIFDEEQLQVKMVSHISRTRVAQYFFLYKPLSDHGIKFDASTNQKIAQLRGKWQEHAHAARFFLHFCVAQCNLWCNVLFGSAVEQYTSLGAVQSQCK